MTKHTKKPINKIRVKQTWISLGLPKTTKYLHAPQLQKLKQKIFKIKTKNKEQNQKPKKFYELQNHRKLWGNCLKQTYQTTKKEIQKIKKTKTKNFLWNAK